MFFTWEQNASTQWTTFSTFEGVILDKFHYQIYTSQFESHRMLRSFGFFLNTGSEKQTHF